MDVCYFENDGTTIAYDLALAIRTLRPKLEPVIVHVINDPILRDDGDDFSKSDDPVRSAPWQAERASALFEAVSNSVAALRRRFDPPRPERQRD